MQQELKIAGAVTRRKGSLYRGSQADEIGELVKDKQKFKGAVSLSRKCQWSGLSDQEATNNGAIFIQGSQAFANRFTLLMHY